MCLGILKIVNRCPSLSAPFRGSLMPCTNLPGETCQFSCDEGYVLSGDSKLTCNRDASWTGTLTHCIGEFASQMNLNAT